MKTNYVTIDLRRLTNEQIWYIDGIVDLSKELKQRGFTTAESLFFSTKSDGYGIYDTLEEYLATFPEPPDNRDITVHR